MFKKRNHGMFCYCSMCRTRRKTSILYNVVISIFLIICAYQLIIIFLAFTRINIFILFLEFLFLMFLLTRSLF